jgi:hypothetical protein
MNDVYFYYSECSKYFNELLELRKKELYLGESEKGTMDLLGRLKPPYIYIYIHRLTDQAQ